MKQILRVSLLNLLNIRSRWSIASVIVVGIGGVVGVLVAILSMAEGFTTVLSVSGEPDRVIILREGSSGEMSSDISFEEQGVLQSMPGALHTSFELYTVADIPKKSTGTPANLIIRGVTAEAFAVRPEVEIVAGRNFQSGRNEVIAGIKAADEFAGLEVGANVAMRDSEWRVVGLFEAGGSSYESEIWSDLPASMSAFRRTSPTVARVRLDSAASLEPYKNAVENDPRLRHLVQSEREYYESQSGTLRTTIEVFAIIVSTIMAIGALFAALNTMYTAVASRTVEIATLRALGFGGFPVVVSVILEAAALAVLGGALGGGVAWVIFNGFTVSTMNPAAFSQIAFDFQVTPDLLVRGMVWAIVIGLIGGLFPAIRAARVPITIALRGE